MNRAVWQNGPVGSSELQCRLEHRGKSSTGTAFLETDFFLFRGSAPKKVRLKIFFKDLTAVSALDGCLRLEFADGTATVELGAAAEKWARKILHPPSLLEKLGVRAGVDVLVAGDFDPAFLSELGKTVKGHADLVLFAAPIRSDLKKVAGFIQHLKARGVIWVVYPKGVSEIREIEVIEAGRAAGLKDTKVARFSATHTALRFSQPNSKTEPSPKVKHAKP